MDAIKNLLEELATKKASMEDVNKLKEMIDNRDKEIDAQMGSMKENQEKALETAMAKMSEAITNGFTKANHEKAPEAPRFKSFDEFIEKVKKNDVSIKDLAEGAGNTGGYLVPEEYRNEILRVNLEQSIVRNSGARIIQMNAPQVSFPALDMSSNANGSIYGGATAYWGNENASITESQPSFDNVKLEVSKLTAYVEDSNEMEQDAITNMGSLLTMMYGEVLAFEEDYAFINGDGVNKPLGILVAPCLVSVSRATASQIHPSDIVNMIARFKGSLDKAVFTVNQSALPQIYQLKDDNGNFIWHPGNSGSIATKAMGTLYGIPMKVTEKNPALGTKGDLILADWSHYLIGDRGGLRTDYSPHFKFQNDQMAYRCIKRVDGQPWLKSAITPRNGGSTLSPFVTIA